MTLGVGYDAEAGLLVAVRDEIETATQHEDLLKALLRVDADAFQNAVVPITILITHPSARVPNAHWRKQYADAAMRAKSPWMFFGLVTDSMAQRGVLTAIQWLTRGTRGRNEAFSTFEAARVAAERQRGVPLPLLLQLREQARHDLRQRVEFAARFHHAL
ncbi:hypothetical protein BH09MYX1_BH09MYX1_45220 [soil metagenome]